jgi:hypothetical protein
LKKLFSAGARINKVISNLIVRIVVVQVGTLSTKETRMILQAMNVTTEIMPNGELIKGDLKVSASNTEELTYMDRLTY